MDPPPPPLPPICCNMLCLHEVGGTGAPQQRQHEAIVVSPCAVQALLVEVGQELDSNEEGVTGDPRAWYPSWLHIHTVWLGTWNWGWIDQK